MITTDQCLLEIRSAIKKHQKQVAELRQEVAELKGMLKVLSESIDLLVEIQHNR
jgi:peptidoglycan hydrolase CwlO-like protein